MKKAIVVVIIVALLVTGYGVTRHIKARDYIDIEDNNTDDAIDYNIEDNLDIKHDTDRGDKLEETEEYIEIDEEDNEEVKENKEIELGENQKLIKSIKDIYLIGEIHKYNEIETLNGLKLRVGENPDITIDVSTEGAMNATLELKDISGDGNEEIIVHEYTGGSGNIQNLYIYSRKKNQLTQIMGPKFYISQKSFYQEYLGDANIYFEDRNTGFKKEYNIIVPYENDGWDLDEIKGRFGMNGKAWVDPYSAFDLVDTNDDNIYEVKANQIICGIAHVDIIGEMTTIYSIDNGVYKPTEVIYYKINHDNWDREEIGRAPVN